MNRFKKFILSILFFGLILLYSRNFKYLSKINKRHEVEYHDFQNFQTEVVMNKNYDKEEDETKDHKKNTFEKSQDIITKARKDEKVLCIVMTSESTYRERIPLMWEYWGISGFIM